MAALLPPMPIQPARRGRPRQNSILSGPQANQDLSNVCFFFFLNRNVCGIAQIYN